MIQTLQWFDGVIMVLCLLGLGLYLYARRGQRARMIERARAEVQRSGALNTATNTDGFAGNVLAVLRRLGSVLPLLSASQRIEASTRLVMAGYRSSQALFVLMGLTLVAILLMIGLAIIWVWPYLTNQGDVARWLALLLAAYMGSLLPRLVLDRLVRRRQEQIRLSLPDALDLLVICTNAGLALNAALERVADELVVVAPALSDELQLTSAELKLSSDIEAVLNGLAQRTDLEGTRALVSTFLQARQYGTAITQALRILAKTERTARMMRLEEKAAKLAVKMTIPMMLFILPTVIIVGAGPAILNIMKYFSS